MLDGRLGGCFEVPAEAEIVLVSSGGSVVILDMLQYLGDDAQQRLLQSAIATLVPGARLVIRTGIEDGSRRMHVTRAFDRVANLLGWMNATPRRYPRAADLRALLADAGLASEFTSLRGKTPFNNWLVVATRPDTVVATSAT